MKLPVPENEEERIKALYEYNILDSLPQEQFDRLTKLASIICNVPISLICFVDKDRQWFKSKVGTQLNQTPRDLSFCQYTIMGNDFFEVEDLLADERFKNNPLVLEKPNIRFYAAYPLIDPNGFALGSLCILDKTPKKLSNIQKEALKTLSEDIVLQIVNNKKNEERRKLEKFFLMSIDMICIAGMDGYFKKVNPAFTNILGWSTGDLLQKPFMDFVHPDDVQMTITEIEKLKSGNQTQNFTNRYRTRYDKYILLDWVANPDLDTGEIFAIARDITFLTKIIEEFEAFAVEKEQLNQALNESTIVSITDQNKKIKFVNDAFCKITKYSREELLGKEHQILHSGYHQKEFFDDLWNTLALGKIWKGEIKNKAKDGTYFWFDTTVVPFIDANKNITRYIFIRHDITQRAVLEEALRKSNEEIERTSAIKEQFLANMSHEIRTPLNAIIGFSEILKKTKLDIEQKEDVKIISMAGETLMRIINDILDFTKIESGNITIEKTPVNIREILDNVKKLFSRNADEKDIELKIFCDNDIPDMVMGDQVRITQVLINLVGNAIKFTNKGKVHVFCKSHFISSKKNIIEFKIIDSGIGIPADKLSVIFDRFVQAEDYTTRKFGGTGLGLSITKTLVGLFGGNISCSSTEGVGSEFTVQIPFDVSGEMIIKSVEKNDLLRLDPKSKILLIEDLLLNQILTDKIITSAGAKIDIAENGKVAIDLISAHSYDIILLDLHMPEMDGYSTTDYIRNVLKLKTPIIAMTANALQGEKEKCLLIGMNDYISKPFKAKELISKINYFLKHRNNNSQSKTDTDSDLKKKNKKGQNYNLEKLDDLSGNDESFTTQYIHAFLSEIAMSLEKINKFTKAGELEYIKPITHKIKASLTFLDSNEAATLCDEIEHSDSYKEVPTKIEQLNIILKRLLEELGKDFS